MVTIVVEIIITAIGIPSIKRPKKVTRSVMIKLNPNPSIEKAGHESDHASVLQSKTGNGRP